MQPNNEPRPTSNPAEWPSLVEFKQSRFPDYDPAVDADADQDEPSGEVLDLVLPD